MSASVVLKNLSWSTPDDHSLFENLSLSFGRGRTGLVGRNGVGKSTLLKIIAGDIAPVSGSVSRSGRVAMLRQSVQVDADETLAEIFAIAGDLARLDRVEAGKASAEEVAEADWTVLARFHSSLARVGLPDLAPDHRLAQLSGGQRTRAFLAALVFQEPDVILLDEPTNNLDREGRQALADLLASWHQGAIVVSHDRDLLERMDTIVELTTLGAKTYGGNWSCYRKRKAIELQAVEHRLEMAARKAEKIDRRIQAAKERKAKKDAVGRRKRAKGDSPKLLMDAMQQRAENTSSANARLADRMSQVAAREAEEARAQVEILKDLSVRINSAELPNGKTVVDVRNLTGGYDPDTPVIRDLSFALVGPQRLAITGPNGSGKTTLFRLLTGALPPFAGTARIHGTHAVLDQTMSLLDPDLSVRENFLRLNPASDENTCRAALARFLFRADAALQRVGSLSGGEMLRAGLAAVLGGCRPPELLLLDEPTNHLDVDSIQAVEAGLAAYDGALLVISHDQTFLEAIGTDGRVSLYGDGRSNEP